MNLNPKLSKFAISDNTKEWLTTAKAEEILASHTVQACEAFKEIGLSERLKNEFNNSLQGGSKVFRIGNSLRSLSNSLAMLALAGSFGITIENSVLDIINSEYIDILQKIDEIKFQAHMQKDPDWKSDLWTADIGSNLSLTYYLGFPIELGNREFKSMIYNKCFMPIVYDWADDRYRIHSLDSMGHNWWSVIIGGACIMSALCDFTEYKQNLYDNLKEWFHFPGNDFSRKMPNFGEKGDYIESFSYAEYALKSPCRLAFIDPIFKLVPDCLNQSQADGLVEWFNNSFISTSDGLIAKRFGDMHKSYKLSPDVIYSLNRISPSDILIEKMHALTPEPRGIFDFLFWEESESKAINKRSNQISVNVFSNSGMTFINNNNIDLSIHAGDVWGHNHLDAGSFIYAQDGVLWIDDSGTCEYTKPEYTNYYVLQQAHNVSYVKELAKETCRMRYEGSLHHGRYLAHDNNSLIQIAQTDTNVLNGGYLLRSNRSFFVINDDLLFIWDDLSGFDEYSYSYYLHTPCGIKIYDDNSIYLVKDDKRCDLRLFSSSEISLSINDEIDGQKSLMWETMPVLRQKFAMIAGTKITSVIWHIDSNSNYICQINSNNNSYTIWFNDRADGKVMHQNCTSTFNNITTDAYAVILSEIANDKTISLIQGSFARINTKMLFSALSRQNIQSISL